MRPFDSIILTEALSDALPAGTEGAIVDRYSATNDVLIVELVDTEGNTLDVCDVRLDQMALTLADFHEGERVALLDNHPRHGLVRGQVGVIKERAGIGLYEVAFTASDGKTYAHITLHAGQMMLLHWEPVTSRLSA